MGRLRARAALGHSGLVLVFLAGWSGRAAGLCDLSERPGLHPGTGAWFHRLSPQSAADPDRATSECEGERLRLTASAEAASFIAESPGRELPPASGATARHLQQHPAPFHAMQGTM